MGLLLLKVQIVFCISTKIYCNLSVILLTSQTKTETSSRILSRISVTIDSTGCCSSTPYNQEEYCLDSLHTGEIRKSLTLCRDTPKLPIPAMIRFTKGTLYNPKQVSVLVHNWVCPYAYQNSDAVVRCVLSLEVLTELQFHVINIIPHHSERNQNSFLTSLIATWLLKRISIVTYVYIANQISLRYFKE